MRANHWKKALAAAIAAALASLLGVSVARSQPAVPPPAAMPDVLVGVSLPDAPPGTYTALVTVVRLVDGDVRTERYTRVVTVGGTKPPPPPIPKADPVNALCRIQMGNAGCTATVVGPRLLDGRWHLLTAAHCGPNGSPGTAVMKDGRRLGFRVVVRDTDADLTWLRTDEPAELPFAELAAELPKSGVPVWHMGYGVDRPGNREDGTVTAVSGHQLEFRLNVSSGDSGGGIFRADTGELVAAVCCTANRGQLTRMWGGHALAARRLRPAVALDEWVPAVIPERSN